MYSEISSKPAVSSKGIEKSTPNPIVTVVIPCYNHAHFLGEAIESVLAQSYNNWEVIVVDDGSSDHTKEVVENYDELIYIKQENKGLSAARNKGLINSRGDYIVFLDADDLLQPDAISRNINYFHNNETCAFISGSYKCISTNGSEISPPLAKCVHENHYEELLRGNFIGMHATVMYNKNILLKEGGFNSQLKACEDYDVYLRLSRNYPVINHQELIASYRRHDSNMSYNIPLMLESAHKVLKGQVTYLKNSDNLIKAYNTGIRKWEDYYIRQYLKNIRASNKKWKYIKKDELWFFIRKLALPYIRYNRSRLDKRLKRVVNRLPFRNNKQTPLTGKIKWGDLRRVNPISKVYGYDRGGPIDRYYIENFLKEHSNVIKGRVLEIGDNEYTMKFGKEKVKKSDILHVHSGNPKATFVGDLAEANHIPSEAFDCIVLTQTLHLIYDYHKALDTCYRILKPGGTLLLTVPGIVQIAGDEWGKNWLWSFTDMSIQLMLNKTFQSGYEIEKFGNVLSATSLLQGIGVKEITKEELDYKDPLYQVIITAKATKRLN